MVKVLFIDDDPQAHKTLAAILPPDYAVLSAYTGGEGERTAARELPDVVLLDIGLPDLDGIEVLKRLVAKPDAPPVVMLTAHSEVAFVKEAIQVGAMDYIVKPYELAKLEGTIRHAIRSTDSQRPPASEEAHEFPAIVGESASIRAVKSLIMRYSNSDSPVLILGESGTGKELAARSLHAASRRSAAPFIALNCGALPENLVETELFGSEKGAYTDAVARPGSFEQANGGSIFLDEVGELSPHAQTKLLRVLEEKCLTRVGGLKPVESDVRVISATNRNLKLEMENKAFRDDLYYRLSVLPLRMPNLRERVEDVPLIALHLLAALSPRAECALSEKARRSLVSHAWPGNVRELRNVLERSLLAGGQHAADGALVLEDIIFE
jgi:DNA-binding NtrC family response regulator